MFICRRLSTSPIIDKCMIDGGLLNFMGLDLSAILRWHREQEHGQAYGFRRTTIARFLHKLSAVRVEATKASGYYADGGGLYLRVAPGGSRAWIFRFARGGKTRDGGLGSYPAVNLSKARAEAERCRQLLAVGEDPIEARRRQRAAAQASSAKVMTFRECGSAVIASHEAGWRNPKHRQQWENTL